MMLGQAWFEEEYPCYDIVPKSLLKQLMIWTKMSHVEVTRAEHEVTIHTQRKFVPIRNGYMDLC